jgi:hypothetical protein
MARLFKDLVASDTHTPTALGNERKRRRIMRRFVINEVSGVDRPAQHHARAVIMKRHDDTEVEAAFNATGEGPAHDKLRARYDNENRGHPFRSAEENFANAWRSLRPVERDEIRAEESGEAQRREAEEAARVRASVDDLGKSVDISALADFALPCRADAIRKTPERRANPSMASWGKTDYLAQQRKRLPTHKFRRQRYGMRAKNPLSVNAPQNPNRSSNLLKLPVSVSPLDRTISQKWC